MTTLTWDQIPILEQGLSQGVLYLEDKALPWVGLVSLEDNTPFETQALYYDGVKYDDYQKTSSYMATLQAITYPEELDDARYFGLSYRTREGRELHLVYNVAAIFDARVYQTDAVEDSLVPFSWTLSGTPSPLSTVKPTAHVIIDVDEFDSEDLIKIEDILYGNDVRDGRLPTLFELISLLERGFRFIIVLSDPDNLVLPLDTLPGDVVFTPSDRRAYAVDILPPSDEVRDVVVTSAGESYSDYAVVGDLIYDESSGVIYRLEE